MKQIIVKPVSATLTRDTECIGKMDPYCVCVLGAEKHQTKYKNEAGKDPKWEDTLVFLNTSGMTVMHVQVWDKDVTNDDLVGEGQIDITHILNSQGMPFNETVNLVHKGKPAGKVFLAIQATPVGGQSQGYGSNQGQGFNQGGRGQGW